jgi:hypothetical protein
MRHAVIAVLTNERVRVMTDAIHVAHIFQVFNVVIFYPFKQTWYWSRQFEEEQPAAAFLLEVHHNFKQTIVELDI